MGGDPAEPARPRAAPERRAARRPPRRRRPAGLRAPLTAAAARQGAPREPAPAPPPFHVARPEPWTSPVVVASPHSGRLYPPDLMAASRLSANALRRSEDAYVDALFAHAPALGAPLICAAYARAYVDLNRAPYDLDPAMFEDAPRALPRPADGRARSGLGSIARIVAEGEEIYRRKLTFSEAEARLARVHAPFHQALEALLDEAHGRSGACVLLDAHSMPSAAAAGAPDVVLGDRHGRACGRGVVEAAEAALRGCGLRVVRNAPFAGGHITARHGRPAAGRHALQVELNRALYLHEPTLAPTTGWAAVQRAVDALVAAVCALRAGDLR
ncbi:MAG: N-formylglutamate amidohydrolase [Caulobacteraceae bacterium]|nr:N-formylglutamate amidohydrolase [Caulobacter sp.]